MAAVEEAVVEEAAGAEPQGEPAPADVIQEEAPAEEVDQGLYLQAHEVQALKAAPASGGKLVHSILERISLAAGVCVEVDESGKVSVASDTPERESRALKYLRLARNVNQGWVDIGDSPDDGDFTIMEVPESESQNVTGRNGEKLWVISEESKTVVFLIDDGPKATPADAVAAAAPPGFAPLGPPEPAAFWLAAGKRVEVKRLGDIRSESWAVGTVREVLRYGKVMVKLDSGLEQNADLQNTRPWYEAGEAVEYHDGDWEWKEAAFTDREEDGKVNVKVGEEQVQVESANLRPLEPKPSPAEEEVKEAEAIEAKEAAEGEETKEEEEEKAWEEPKERMHRFAIFGELVNRSEAVLRIMNFVAQKRPGYFANGEDGSVDVAALDFNAPAGCDWGMENWELGQEFLAQCIGSKGSMRKKLKTASACNLEYLGSTACICGPSGNRAFCRVLLETLRSAERGNVPSISEEIEQYCETLEVPLDVVPFVTGGKRMWLNKVEEDEGVITFWEGAPPPDKKKDEWKGDAAWKKQDASADNWTWTEEKGWQEKPQEGAAKDEEAPAEAVAQAEEGEVPEEAGAEAPVAAAEEAAAEVEAAPKAEEGEAPAVEGEGEGAKAEVAEAAAEEAKDAEADEPEAPAFRKVAILAWSLRSRMRARLRLENTVEQKHLDHYSQHYEIGNCEDEGVGRDVVEMWPDDITWAVGKKGRNKITLQNASGCAIEYIGTKALIVGTAPERERARQYLQWLLEQRPKEKGHGDRSLSIPASILETRSDLTVVQITTEEKQKLDFETLSTIEQESSTFIFFRDVPVPELLSVGARFLLNRGGREVCAEVVESGGQQEDGKFKLELRLCDEWEAGTSRDEVEKQAVVPILIFGRDAGSSGASGRSLAAAKIREHLAPAQAWEAEAWEEPQSAPAWEEPAKSWDKPDKGSWDKPQSRGGGAEQCGDFKRGNCSRGDSCRFAHGDDTAGGHDRSSKADDSSWKQHDDRGDRGGDRGHQAAGDAGWKQSGGQGGRDRQDDKWTSQKKDDQDWNPGHGKRQQQDDGRKQDKWGGGQDDKWSGGGRSAPKDAGSSNSWEKPAASWEKPAAAELGAVTSSWGNFKPTSGSDNNRGQDSWNDNGGGRRKW